MQLWEWTTTVSQLSTLLQGHTPLHCAAQCNSAQTVDFLTCQNVNIDSRNSRVSLSHNLTCCPEPQRACFDVTAAKLFQACMHELQGQPPLHLAIQHDAYESIQVLLSRGADLNIQDHRVRSFSLYHMTL